jgi:hypothetical protein
MKFEGEIDGAAERELLMDMASIVIGAFLKGTADQLDIGFSQGHPLLLGYRTGMKELLAHCACGWNRTLAIEMAFTLEGRRLAGTLLIVFTEESIKPLDDLIALTFA